MVGRGTIEGFLVSVFTNPNGLDCLWSGWWFNPETFMADRPGLVCTLVLFLAGLLPGLRPARGEEPIRLNQIQVIGTHNSYHLAPSPSVLRLVGPRGPEMGKGLDYGHRPLAEQFSVLGIRQVELDLFADPVGGRYARPAGRLILEKMGRDPGPDPDEGGQLRTPGPKIFHIQDIDYRSTVATFAEALRQIHSWSATHPRHVPILVQIELKETPVFGLPTRPAKFGRSGLDAVDREIRVAFPDHALLTPDDVRGESASLPEAIRSRGWPLLDDVRGQVLFALDVEAPTRDLYLQGHSALAGRAMFVAVAADHPAAAWMIVNDPIKDFEQIQSLVRSGFLVRTRADAETLQARQNDPLQREKALASGAQFVSTDFPEPRPEFSPYHVRLPGNVVARSNPLNGPKLMPGVDLEATESPAHSATTLPLP